MKRHLFTLILCSILTFLVIYKLDDIVNLCAPLFNETPKVVLEDKNRYAKNKNYEYVNITEDFVPYNFQDLLNIFYTVLDSGYDNFTFYCPSEYLDCVNDVVMISKSKNKEILTNIGNYISPYNNYTDLNVFYNIAGEITIEVNHLYTEEEILKLNKKIDSIWNEIVTNDMSNEDIIYAFHDYIINHTKYDELYIKELKEKKTPTYQSSKAIGPFFEGYAICSGYTDAMAIILDRLKINNYKVASNTHVWNALYINDEWVHLDLTWDDPVSEDHSINHLLHKFFLIDTKTLEQFDIKDHTFDKSVYLELK